jgi:hypothetical protein
MSRQANSGVEPPATGDFQDFHPGRALLLFLAFALGLFLAVNVTRSILPWIDAHPEWSPKVKPWVVLPLMNLTLLSALFTAKSLLRGWQRRRAEGVS